MTLIGQSITIDRTESTLWLFETFQHLLLRTRPFLERTLLSILVRTVSFIHSGHKNEISPSITGTLKSLRPTFTDMAEKNDRTCSLLF